MREKLSGNNDDVSWIDFSMLSTLLLLGALVATVIIMLWCIISNIAEIIRIRHLKTRHGRKYVESAWGTRMNCLMTQLIAEILVALTISALIIIMLSGRAL